MIPDHVSTVSSRAVAATPSTSIPQAACSWRSLPYGRSVRNRAAARGDSPAQCSTSWSSRPRSTCGKVRRRSSALADRRSHRDQGRLDLRGLAALHLERRDPRAHVDQGHAEQARGRGRCHAMICRPPCTMHVLSSDTICTIRTDGRTDVSRWQQHARRMPLDGPLADDERRKRERYDAASAPVTIEFRERVRLADVGPAASGE